MTIGRDRSVSQADLEERYLQGLEERFGRPSRLRAEQIVELTGHAAIVMPCGCARPAREDERWHRLPAQVILAGTPIGGFRECQWKH